jgi:DNA repair protein RAD16
MEFKPECPVCHLPMSIDLDQDAIEVDTTNRQGFLSRIDPTKARTSTKIEALCVLLLGAYLRAVLTRGDDP